MMPVQPHQGDPHPAHASPASPRGRAGLVAGLTFLLLGSTGLGQEPAYAPLRFGFAREAFLQVNESDVRAALKIWVQTLGSERGIPVDTMMELYATTNDIRTALQQRKVDAVTMSTEQYWNLRQDISFGSLVLGRTQGRFTEEYVLLVPRDAPVGQISELRGQRINIIEGNRGGLGEIWLEVLLLDAKQGVPADFWGRVTRSSKPGSVVLPVFFKQAEACVVTRSGFNTMTELNPQVGRQLRVLAVSPPLVPTVFCFREDAVSPYRDKLLAELEEISGSVAGRQTLALFQSEQLAPRPTTDLDETCALLDRHARLLTEAKAVAAAARRTQP